MLEGMATCGSNATDSAGPSKGSSPNGSLRAEPSCWSRGPAPGAVAPWGARLLPVRGTTWGPRRGVPRHWVADRRLTRPRAVPVAAVGTARARRQAAEAEWGLTTPRCDPPRGARRAARLPAAPARRRGTFRNSAPSPPTCTGGGTGGEGCRPSGCWSSPTWSRTRSGRYGWVRCRSGAGSTRNRPTRIERYLSSTEPYDYIHLNLFSQGCAHPESCRSLGGASWSSQPRGCAET
jgi:hypothetical protein